MNSRNRILIALNHKEPDRIPFDLGGMAQSGIHWLAYTNLRRYLMLPDVKIKLLNIITQVARLDTDFQERLLIDTDLVYSDWASSEKVKLYEEGNYFVYTDEWGIGRCMPKEKGCYFDIYSSPLDVDDVEEKLKHYSWPNPSDPARFNGLKEEAKNAREKGKFVVLMGLCPGIVEMYSWLRGFVRFYTDLATEPKIVTHFLDKMMQLKIDYWEHALSETGEYIDAVNEADDVAGQIEMLISPTMYRQLIKPYHRAIFAAIKKFAPHVKILFHSCGAIRPIIPDLIEIGVDILNPIQITAKDMNPLELKKEFGKNISFWGGAIDTQHVLVKGSVQEIRDHVRRNIEALALGGGFVFSPVHIIQPDIPPENFMVMWEVLQEYG